jgi:hypothetical protein
MPQPSFIYLPHEDFSPLISPRIDAGVETPQIKFKIWKLWEGKMWP